MSKQSKNRRIRRIAAELKHAKFNANDSTVSLTALGEQTSRNRRKAAKRK